MKQLPQAYINRMKALLGDEFDSYVASLDSAPVRAFRVNTDKISTEEFEKINEFSAEKIPYSETGYYFTSDKIGNHPFHHAGMIYVQEPAAMAPAECAEIDPDWWVLDMCAAPGGKSLMMSENLTDDAVLTAFDRSQARQKLTKQNFDKKNLRHKVVWGDLADLTGSFDLVLADVPCSNTGVFRRRPDALWNFSTAKMRELMAIQRDILESAFQRTASGGLLIYSTCSIG